MNALAAYLYALAGLSLIAIGGANTVLPELHALTVTQHHWVSSLEFAQLFAIAQAAPGPNVLIVAVLGWKIAGVGGALASIVAMVAPSSLIAFVVSRAWTRFRGTAIVKILAVVLSPVAVGLVTGSGVAIATTIGPSYLGIAFVAVVAIVVMRTKVSPLLILGVGALAGMLHVGI